MTSKIFRSTLLVAVVILLCSLSVVMGVLYTHFSGVQVAQLQAELSLAVTGTEQYGNAFLENVEADRFRITWIDTDGTVLIGVGLQQLTLIPLGQIHRALQKITVKGAKLVPIEQSGIALQYLRLARGIENRHARLLFVSRHLARGIHARAKKSRHLAIDAVDLVPGLIQLCHGSVLRW
jgi:hypothetical protein